jgi:hypothetical protein
VACRRARPPPTPPRGDGTARKESIMGPRGTDWGAVGQARAQCQVIPGSGAEVRRGSDR